jgi:hypothetical protein
VPAATRGEDEGREERVADQGERQERVVRSAQGWADRLVDYTRRNPLAYFQSGRRTMLRLNQDDGADQQCVQRLLTGEAVRLSALVPDESIRQRALTRARTLRARAKENFEERGLQTLYLLQGFVSWDVARGEDRPSVPVLLWPVDVTPRGGDLELRPVGDAQVNPMLARMLARTHQISLDESSLRHSVEDGGRAHRLVGLTLATTGIAALSLNCRPSSRCAYPCLQAPAM